MRLRRVRPPEFAGPPKTLHRRKLELSRGLTPDFSCRGGSCGTCRTRIIKGAAAYLTLPTAEVAEDEALICCNAATGDQLWEHEDKATQFWDGQAGSGPRATPTFVDGKLYTFGGTGILNCLLALGALNGLVELGCVTPDKFHGFGGDCLHTEEVLVSKRT